MVIQPLVGNPYNGYINPYYWVDDHPLLLYMEIMGVKTLAHIHIAYCPTYFQHQKAAGVLRGFRMDNPIRDLKPWHDDPQSCHFSPHRGIAALFKTPANPEKSQNVLYFHGKIYLGPPRNFPRIPP